MSVTRAFRFAVLVAATAAGLVPPLAAAEESAPSPVLERFLTVRDREVRTSLFSNGVVVVSARRGDERIFLRQLTLDGDVFAGYLTAIQRDGTEIAGADELPDADEAEGSGTVVLYTAPGGPIRFRYSSVRVYNLAVTRLLATIDDLERHVMVAEPTGANLEGWRPRDGDVVRLRQGGLAEVVEVRDDGTLVVEHQSTYIQQLIPASEIRAVIFDLVERAR